MSALVLHVKGVKAPVTRFRAFTTATLKYVTQTTNFIFLCLGGFSLVLRLH